MLNMEACRSDLGFLEAGDRVTVEISGPARVRLMEPESMLFAQFGFAHLSYGGYYSAGSVAFEVGEPGCWWLVVDVADLAGAMVRVSTPEIQRRQLVPG